LGLLGYFKYANYFIQSLVSLGGVFGVHVSVPVLQIVLPVGISFYTFQTLSYTIDVYRGRVTPRTSIVDFFGYVSFFPQLVAGPIERADRLLPQFESARRLDVDTAADGARQILWGFVKKLVVADNLAVYVDQVYASPDSGGGALALATFFFAFQIYCDFSGYSDIAIGTAKLLGFRLMRNFAYPYFARNIKEFWGRWHISLSTWFRDYLYIPLGGNRKGMPRRVANLLATFVVSGLWHGAGTKFVVWGLLHGLYYIPVTLRPQGHRGDSSRKRGDWFGCPRHLLGILLTFFLVNIAWVFFRADTVPRALQILHRIFFHFNFAEIVNADPFLLYAVLGLIVVEWLQRHKEHPMKVEWMPRPLRWVLCYVAFLLILGKGRFTNEPFIYFQF
jgi:D-alanyl-lipoteichoic acid acyltransferase DltB (MBOAT superfamily)